MPGLDRLARLAAVHLQVPLAIVSVAERDRQVVLGAVGLPAELDRTREIPASYFDLPAVLAGGKPVVVEDAREHTRLRSGPWLQELAVASYLGVPITTREGQVLGSFCSMDREPRRWTPEDVRFLEDLAASVVTEIALREEMRERARERERTTHILGRITDAFIALDARWHFTYINPATERLLGRESCELLGCPLFRVIAPDSLPVVQDALTRVSLGQADEVDLRARVRRPSGEERLLAISATAIRDGGAVTGLQCVLRDVGDNGRVEASLRESEDRFRQIADNVNEVFWVFTPDFSRALYLSPAYERVTGRKVEDVYRNAREFLGPVHPDDRSAVLAAMGRIHEQAVEGVEFRYRHVDGSDRWFLARGYPVRDATGEVFRVVGTTEDITERKRAQHALAESERRYRTLFESVDEGYCVVHVLFDGDRPVDFRILEANPAFSRFTGLVDAVGRTARELVPRLEDRWFEVYGRVAATGETARFELGSEAMGRFFDVFAFRVAEPADRKVAIRFTEITERRRAELALRESEGRLQQILDALPVAVLLVDAAGQLVWHNPAARALWGDVRPLRLDLDIGEYRGWRPDSGKLLRTQDWPLARALRGETVTAELIDIEAFDGERKSTLVSAVPLRGAAGELSGAIAVQEDMTEARARDAQQRLLAAALNGLHEGICLLTQDGHFVYANETFGRLLGLDPARVAGLCLAELGNLLEVSPEQREGFRTALELGRWSGRVRRRTSDGAEIPVDVVLGRLDQDGPGSGLIYGVVQDATDTIQRERQLRRAERLASVGTLIGGVAHELFNPLQAVQGFAEFLLLNERCPDRRQDLETIRREAERMAKIVADLRLIARQTQEGDGAYEVVDLNDVVRHILKVRRYSLETGNVSVRVELADDLPQVRARRGEIEQVVLNLVVNAEQAMAGAAGERRIVLRTSSTPDGASIHVVDSGHGIPAQHLDHIFDPFFTTKAPGEGTGLGLSLAHSIVSEHGGRIHARSEPGKGAEFRVDLPHAAAPPEPRAEAEPPAEPARSLRILVVDDEPSIRRLLELFLRQLGHRVDSTEDGRDALRRIEDTEYDLILSDLRMPGLGGEELLHRLREQGKGLERRLIFITGDAAGSHAARLAAEADVPMLVKPVHLQALARAVEVATRS